MYEILVCGLEALREYLSAHVLTCLVPAFFIAGAISALISKGTILKYFGTKAKKWLSYSVASVSGTILAVCSCTILPMFASVYKRGAGIGPAFAFLYSGPAINLLAIVLTASVLGLGIGVARAAFAISMAVIIGLIMSSVFERGEKKEEITKTPPITAAEKGRPWYVTLTFFILLVIILLVGASGLISWFVKLAVLSFLIIGVAVVLIFYYSRDEVNGWGLETWWLAKRIFPILLLGVFVVGVIGGVAAAYSPSQDPQTAVGELTKPYFGNNSIFSCLLASVIGAVLYMPTLLEVPIVGSLFGYSSGLMASGPALSLLLAGPSLSLPSIIVILRTAGWKKTTAYIVLVVLFSTLMGLAYGSLVG